MKRSTPSSTARTAREVFVDTSGFYSLLVAGDDQHSLAARILEKAGDRQTRFLTTDYVLDETVTLLVARGHRRLVAPFLQATLGSTACRIEWTEPARFSETVAFLLKHEDHPWSFTDCLSFVVMKTLRLREALTKDINFEQAGFVALLR
jgi:predicted nucleic acid-binding protein